LGPRGRKLTGGWRKLHNETCNLHILPNIISGGSNEGRGGHVLRRTEMHVGILYEKLNKDDKLEDLVIDRIILKSVFRLISYDS